MQDFAWSSRRSALVLLGAAIGLGCAGTAHATGFYVNQQSVKGLGRVGAGDAAVADGLGTIFANPAGLTEIWDGGAQPTRMSIGAHLIIPRNKLGNTGSTAGSPGTGFATLAYPGINERNPTDPTPIPNVYWARVLEPGRLAVGAGINAPFGLATKLDSAWFGRYDSIEAALRTVNLSAVAAYKFDSGVSLGGGIDLQYANSRLAAALPDPLAPGGPSAATDGRAETRGHGWKAGYNIGVLLPLSDATRVGLHYRSGMDHKLSGNTLVSGLAAPLDVLNGRVRASANLNLPGIASIGVRHKVTDDLALLGQVDWFQWSRFKEVRIRFADGSPDQVREARYRNAYGVSIGAEYRVDERWTARGGLRFDQTPTVDAFRDTTVPDADRLWLGLGASYGMGKAGALDFAFNQVFFRSSSIALSKAFYAGTPLATTVNINGRVRTRVNTVSVDYRFSF